MNPYRQSGRLKLGLILFAVLIAVASLWYTHRLVDRLSEREEAVIQLWASALMALPEAAREQSVNPYQDELRQLEAYLLAQRESEAGSWGGAEARVDSFVRAVRWAQEMPPTSELNFIASQIIVPNTFNIPAIITDVETQQPQSWRNVPVPAPDSVARLSQSEMRRAYQRLRQLQQDMDEAHVPLAIELNFSDTAGGELSQRVHYGESRLVRELRLFPYVQLLFVGLFVLVGYMGFSYVRRSEQSSLWVGMAKEAAHQLGTPITSLMGWLELLRMQDIGEEQKAEAYGEIEKDIERLQQVANRFSDIGSRPRLEKQPLSPLIEDTTEYIRRRIPRQGTQVAVNVSVPGDLEAPINAELFEWVFENLLKNALDAIESEEGRIDVEARRHDGRIHIDVTDNGKGIDRRQWRNVFRPGYSTKKRGWGLGLSLANRIVEDYHGGTLTIARSKVGEGTTFRIDLPSQS